MLSIVIPTYKEAKNVDILLPQIYTTIKQNLPELQILIVDDDSNDGIKKVVRRHNEICGGIIDLKIRNQRKGLASAWKEGIADSKGDIIGILDADLAHNPKDILRMLEELKSADMVIGSRYLPHNLVIMEGKSILAAYLSITGQWIARFILKINIYDMSHSFRVFRQEVFKKVGHLLQCEGNAMMVEFTFHAHRTGFHLGEIPVSYGKRLHGKTKLKILNEGQKFLRILLYLRRTYLKGKYE